MNGFVIPSKEFRKRFVEAPLFSNLQDALRFDASTFDKMPALEDFFRRPCPEELLEATMKGVDLWENRLLTSVIKSTPMGIIRCVMTIPEKDLTNGATLLPMTFHFARGMPDTTTIHSQGNN